MTTLYRTILGIKRPPSGFAVTFTVKEWFLDPDHVTPFTDTEVAALAYMTVKIDGVEQLTNAAGQTTFSLAPGTYTYEVYDMVRYLTTRKATITVTDAAVSVDVKIYACLYTAAQINTMISTESYIPVASASEFDGLRNATGRRMGQGTIFDTVSNVTTGVDKKYIQVANVDVGLFNQAISNSSNPITGVYDGNNTFLQNYLYTAFAIDNSSMFGWLSSNAQIRNIKVVNADMNVNRRAGVIISAITGTANCVLENIVIYKSKILSNVTCSFVGGLVGQIAHASGTCTISNCYIEIITEFTTSASTPDVSCFIGNKVNGGNLNVFNCGVDGVFVGENCKNNGLFLGSNTNNSPADYENCWARGSLNNKNTSFESFTGGFVGRLDFATIRNSWADVDVTNGGTRSDRTGGFAGGIINAAKIYDSYSLGNVTSLSSSIGGFVGQIFSANNIIQNCYSIGAVSGTTSLGGFCGSNSGTINNCYYDKDSSGRTDTGKGLPRTTAQMKNGTASSFINPDGTIDGTNNPANAMFTGWDALIWDFTDITKYPELL